jgi:hypothetical protein
MTRENPDSQLLDAFMLGWKVALEAHDIEAASPNIERMLPLLKEIADGQSTLVLPPEKLLREHPQIPKQLATLLRQNAAARVAYDRELAERILRAMPGQRTPKEG